MKSTTVVVTRPIADAKIWASALKNQGHPTCIFPLIEITTLPFSTEKLHQLVQFLQNTGAILFVSRPAVDGFFAQHASIVQTVVQKKISLWVTGLGTKNALLQQSIPEQQIVAPNEHSVQFDSQHLWQTVQNHIVQRVLVVRGCTQGVDANEEKISPSWFVKQLLNRSVVVDYAVVYRREMPKNSCIPMFPPQTIWLLSSSEAVQNLVSMAKIQFIKNTNTNLFVNDYRKFWSTQRALATHPKISATVLALPKDSGICFAQVDGVRPVLDDVLNFLNGHAL